MEKYVPYLRCPANVIDTENWSSCVANGCVKIRETFGENEECITVPAQFQKIAKMYPENPALVYQENHEWKKINFEMFYSKSRIIAKAFLKLGLRRYHSVCILSGNRPEWFYANMAAIMCGGFSTGLNVSSSAAACLHFMKSTTVDIVIVENDIQLGKIVKIKEQVPELKIVIQLSAAQLDKSTLSWNDVMIIGNHEPDDYLDAVISSLAVNECCTIVFTSGTTSLSKTVMLSHDNLIFNAKMVVKYLGLRFGCEKFLSYLPLNHIAAQSYDFYVALICGACVYCPNKDVLKEDIIPLLRFVRPTIFFGVPRIWEKIKNCLKTMEKNQETGPKSWLLKRAMSVALAYREENSMWLTVKMLENKLHQYLILNQYKEAVGLNECRINLSLGAPISVDVKKYLMSFDIALGEAYGMSECSGGHIISARKDIRLHNYGKTLPGVCTKIDEPDENGIGELCIYGRHVFMGYLNDKSKTEETIDKEGWLHSGDLACHDKKLGYLICGRLKELFITTGGKKLSPILIEQAVKNELPMVSETVIVADGRKFVSLLITLKCEKNVENDQPLNELHPDSKAWCQSVGSSCTTVSAILRESPPHVLEALQQGIDRVNEKVCSSIQQIRKFTVLPREFSVASGELSETMKLKRYVIYHKYKEEIDRMYSQ